MRAFVPPKPLQDAARARTLGEVAVADYAPVETHGMSSDNDDRRRAYRAPIELKVEYKRLNTFFADYTKNISRGGTFIGTDKPLPIGTEFVFALGVPNMTEPLRLRGKVIWITPPEEATRANPSGMGIEFQYDPGEREQKEGIVERLLSVELGEHLAEKLLGRKPQG